MMRIAPLAAALRLGFLAVVGLTVFSTALPSRAEAPSSLPYGEGLLWRIDTPGSRPSYLFCTISLNDPRVTNLPRPVVKALEDADSLSTHLVLDDETLSALGAEMQLTGGQRLNFILGEALYAEVLEASRPYGILGVGFRTMKPWAIQMLMGMTPEQGMRIIMGAPSVDGMLQDMALANGVPIRALETVAEVTAALGGLPEADQIAMLRWAIDMQAELHAQVEAMVQYYLARDLEGLHLLYFEQPASLDSQIFDRYMENVVGQRNLLMADRMAPALAEGNAFVAVDALHLPGEDGLLDLLSQRGHGVARIY